MIIDFDNFFNDDSDIYNNVVSLLTFLHKILDEYNNIIVKRVRLLDFFDLFFYMLDYNSTNNPTHRSSNYNFNVNNNFNVSENAFINRLVDLDSEYIKKINDKFITFFYTLFNIDITPMIYRNLHPLKNNFFINKKNYLIK
jgi:hypothetical protein